MTISPMEVDRPPSSRMPVSMQSFALSRRQTLLWLDEQLYPGTPYYNIVLTIDMVGPLDVQRFAQAWTSTVAAHDALRIVVDAREPRQWVKPGAASLTEVTLPDEPSLAAWIADNCARPLAGPDVRHKAALLHLPGDRHVFYLCAHHIVFDGWSARLLAEDLAGAYLGRKPAPSSSFAEYTRFDAAHQESPKGKTDDAYWTARLVPAVPPLRLYGRARTDRSIGIATLWHDGGGERAERLLALAERDPWKTVSPALSHLVVVATALSAFLYRASGQREVLLGMPFRNRLAPFARTCGLLMEQIFVRVEIDELETFTSLATKMANELREAVAHGRACVSDRGLDYVALNMMPMFPRQFAGLNAQLTLGAAPAWPGGHTAGHGDLRDTFGVQLFDFAEGELRIGLSFHAATFDLEMRRRASEHFFRVLDAMIAAPDTAIDAVDLLDDGERRQVLAVARGPEPEGWAVDVVEQFRRQVARRPDHVAVEAPEGTFSYAEFHRLTNALAHKLRALGVGRESRVGVALPRGARELAAMLAAYKAGGAYVPVDPSHPVDRVRLILEDAAPEVLISPSESPLTAAVPPGTKLLALDDLRVFDDPSAPDMNDEVVTNQLAYILFTSGSTGRPKGVEVPRAAFANFLRAMAVKPGLSEDDRLLAITTTTFDIAGLELFLPLWVGATVVIADRDTASDPRKLAARLDRSDVTMLQATPATWRLLLEANWKGSGRLRMLCGGEAMSPELADKLTASGAELWNMYGPTETTVWSTVERVERGAVPITVGRPIDYTQIYVLDAGRKLVPAGVVGELYIGGRGLARGYRGRPDLTSERFVADPFGGPEERIYRTGDLARLLFDGRFECLGRVDHQVKIRGFRIELGEIESVLRGAEGVKEVLVVADVRRGDPVLCAYWVGEGTREALRQRAVARLPGYMVPSAYVNVPVFPLNSNGKIDRKALPPPETGAALPSAGTAPRGSAEERMAAIWGEVLGLSRVSVDQSFFDLGGTSLTAIQARALIEKSFGAELPLRAFFETPTIAELVSQVGNAESTDEPIVMVLRRGKSGALPVHCLVGIEIYRDLAQAFEGDWPVVGMHVPLRYVPGRDSVPSVPEIAMRYVNAVRRRQPEGPYHLAGLCFGGIVAFEAARQLEAAGQSVATVAIFDGYLPSAMRVDRSERLLGTARRALSTPRSLLPIAREKLVRSVARFKNRPAFRGPGDGKPVDLPIDGEEIDLSTERYEQERGVLRTGHLIVFHATGRDWPSWVKLAPDLGWGTRAPRVTVHEVPSDHLELVRPPHVRTVAAIMEASLVSESPRQSVATKLR